MNGPEGLKMVEAVEKARVPNMVWYNYRRVPAVTLAKKLIDEGRLGKIFHYRAKFLQDWTITADLPQGGAGLWRLDAAAAGSGVTGDLLAHCIDTAIWLNGGIDDVNAMTETFIKERKHNLTGKVEKVGIDDACAFLCRFHNGSLGLFESTRYARGHKALYTFEINGENASHQVGPARSASPAILRPPRRRQAPRLAQHPRHRQRSSLHGQMVGAGPADRLRASASSHQVADFIEASATGKPAQPDFRNAYRDATGAGRGAGFGEGSAVAGGEVGLRQAEHRVTGSPQAAEEAACPGDGRRVVNGDAGAREALANTAGGIEKAEDGSLALVQSHGRRTGVGQSAPACRWANRRLPFA